VHGIIASAYATKRLLKFLRGHVRYVMVVAT